MVQHLNSVGDLETTATNNGKSKAIPLPPPPSSQFTNGNAYGGNQSFIQSSSDMVMGAPLVVGSSTYWDTSAVAGSSNSGAKIPGVVGLTNIGNTCFMNSGLQCLLNTPSICEFFLKAKSFSSTSQKFALLNQFQCVVKQAWHGSKGKINLHEFKSCLALIHSQFNDSRQHDCQEFMALLLDSLHEQLKKWTESQKELEVSESTCTNLSPNIENERPQTPVSWASDEAATSENGVLVPIGKGISATQSKGINSANLPDVVFSQSRKQSGVSLRSNETVSKYKNAVRSSPHSKNPVHSGLKSQSTIRSKILGNCETKFKYQSKNTRLRGATTSLFQLPNFTPVGCASRVSNDKDISSTSSDTATSKWMDLKNSSSFGRFVSKNRKKKIEDEESPGSPKKTKLDSNAVAASTDSKRKLEFLDNNDQHSDGENSGRYFSKHSKKEEGSVIPTHLCNGEGNNSQSITAKVPVDDDETKTEGSKLPPRRPTRAEEAARAESFWKNHINANNTVIAKTFQGLLKSTVICSTCDYNSVTYEPFMYLSLPFPRVLERKLAIWFISMKDRRPIKLEVTVGLMDNVRKVKQEVGKIVPGEPLNEADAEKLLLAEVCNFSVQRLIANSTLVRKLSENRNLYVFQLNENFDEKYSSCLSRDQGNFSFSGSFVNSDSVNSVSSTTQMNASTYLDEDWDQDNQLSGSEATLPAKEPYGPALPCGSMEGKEPLTDLNWDEQTESNDLTMKSSDAREACSAADVKSPLAGPEGDSVFSDKLACGIEVGSSAESICTADTTLSDDVCSLEAGSSEADDSGLGSGTSDTTESTIIGGTCECADSPQFSVSINHSDVNSIDESSDVPELTPCAEKTGSEAISNVVEPFDDDVDAISASDDQVGTADVNHADGRSSVSMSDQLADYPETVSSSAGATDLRDWKPEAKSEGTQCNTMQCIICLEDCNSSDMRQHVGCDCVICSNCVKSSIQHFVDATDSSTNSKLKCATCMKIVHGSEFVPYRSTDSVSVKLTMEIVPLIFRLDPNPDSNNNSFRVPRAFGYPWVLKLPSSIPAQEFYDYIAEINPFPQSQCKVISVSSDGKSCGQCGYTSPCTGCELPKVGNISFRYRTSLAISYTDLSVELLSSIEPTDMAIEEHSFGTSSWGTPGEPNYDIHDCLRAFSEIEHLDEQNPWFCPHCDKNQCATKALSVCHFPDYLIVYLKRFVFLDHSSNKLNNKLKFPVSELDLGEYIAEEFNGKEWKYDLYGCICHFGSVSSGHYTAYGKNPVTSDWHYFNDDIVSQQCPKDLEHSSAYVLFYSRKGASHDIPLQSKVRPLPGLNTLAHSRPVSVVPPSNKADDPWDPEDEEVSSSSTDFSFQPQPVHCNFSGGTVDSVEEMSLSVGTRNHAMSPQTSFDEEYNWDDVKDPIATVEESKIEGIKKYQPDAIGGEETGKDYDSSSELINREELPGSAPQQTLISSTSSEKQFAATSDQFDQQIYRPAEQVGDQIPKF